MSLEAIAAMLGHKSLDMTLVYAKIANRTVAEEYFTVAEKVDALYASPAQLPADALGPNMARLNREHHRLLGNGYCVRPTIMDCEFENTCETCTYFTTGPSSDPPCSPTRRRLRQRTNQTSPDLREPHRHRRPHRSLLTTITHIMPS